MTLGEAESLIDRDVFWDKDGESRMVRIYDVTAGGLVLVRGAGNNVFGETARPRYLRPGELRPIPWLELSAAAQAQLNEFTFAVLMDTRWSFDQTDAALDALCNLNWAVSRDFDSRRPPPTGTPEQFAERAVRASWRLWNALNQEGERARGQGGFARSAARDYGSGTGLHCRARRSERGEGRGE